MSTILDLQALRRLMIRCLDQCESELGRFVDLKDDFYWLLEPSDAFAGTSDPPINLGHLTDDLASIAEALDEEPNQHHHVSHEIGHMVGPLTRLAVAWTERQG